MEAIRVEALRKKYKDIIAVDDLGFSVGQGELFSLLGVNGAGKTTTVKMLSCLTSPTCGDAFINGKSIVKEQNEVKKMVSLSPQETAVASALTAYENLEFICGIYDIPQKARKARIMELSDALSLDAVLDKKAGKLSGGWQRRLSIAMALISDPQILFLDEPTLGLDVISRSELWEVIRSLKNKSTIILTTHYMEEAEALSDRVGIMKDGKMLICDTMNKIKETANTDNFEQAFIRIVRGE